MSTWLIDNSAWARRFSDNLGDEEAQSLADDLEAGRLITCLPFQMEAGYSARDAADHRSMMDLFRTFPSVHLDSSIEDRTVDAQSQLAQSGNHRIPPVDVLIAAMADRSGHGVLHYDAHYDLILDHTDLFYESKWLAPRGSL